MGVFASWFRKGIWMAPMWCIATKRWAGEEELWKVENTNEKPYIQEEQGVIEDSLQRGISCSDLYFRKIIPTGIQKMGWSIQKAELKRRSHQVMAALARVGGEQLERNGQTGVSFMNSEK